MRSILLSFILLLGISALNPADANASDERATEAALNNAGAVQAVAIANQLKWTNRKVKTYVKGEIVKSPRNLIKSFPNKFELVAGEPSTKSGAKD